MVWKHKDTYCHALFCLFPHKSVPGAWTPMRVRAEPNSEILAEQFPIVYKRQLLLRVPKWTYQYNNSVGHGIKDNARAFILASISFKFRIYYLWLVRTELSS